MFFQFSLLKNQQFLFFKQAPLFSYLCAIAQCNQLMNIKKLIPELVSNIINTGFDTSPKTIQGLSIPKIKSGADLFMIGPKDSGKTTALIIGIIQQLKTPIEEAPRAIIMASTRDKAHEIEKQFKILSKGTNLRYFTAFDQGILQYQKDMIYEGLDVLIVTPKRLSQLLNVMGVPMVKIKILAIDDTDTITLNNYGKIIYRVTDTIENAQFILAADKWKEDFDRISDRIMKNPQIVKIDEEK